MQNVTDKTRNPFGMRPDCPSFVPGYGDANADFHVVGDHPGVHGGLEADVPFTGEPWSPAFLSALTDAGLLAGLHDDADPDGVPSTGGTSIDPIRTDRAYLSYLHMCAPERRSDEGSTGEDPPTEDPSTEDPPTEDPSTEDPPTEDSYANMERFFDAELRAIAAHVLLPVGARATEHVLERYTARAWKTDVDMDALHGEELLGAGWLVLPIKDPADWRAGDADRLVSALRELRSTDFRRESDLGRFIAGSDPYLVR